MPKKKGTLRKDNLYEYKGAVGRDVNGKTARKSFYSAKSLDDAKKQYNDFIVKKEIAERTERSEVLNCTFEDWALRFLEIYKKGKCKDNTLLGTYEIPIKKHLIPAFGKRVIRSIQPLEIQLFFDDKGKTCSLEYLRKFHSCLWSIFETAIENNYCARNPVTRRITMTSVKPPPKKNVWTKKQYNVAIDFLKKHPLGLSLWLLAETGISRSELLGIRREKFDYALRVLIIEDGTVELKDAETGRYMMVTDGLKNDYRQRIVPIADDELLEALHNIPETISVGGNAHSPGKPVTSEFLFCSPTGKVFRPQNWDKRIFDKVMDELVSAHPDLPRLTAHELRHTRATLWKNSGVDPLIVARLLGHANLKMLSKKYYHADIDALKEALGMTADI